jgi:hypothetical protein
MYDQLDYAKRQIDKSFTNIKECVIASYTLSILDAFLHYFHPPTIKQITRDRIITTELTIVNWRFDGADMIGEIDGVQRKYKHCDYLQSTHSYDIKNTEHVLAYEFNKVMETITKELPQPIAEDVNWFLKP